ncbi:glycosyltransferase [Treponema sp. OMZ 792]|uniref:glycosyltransferase n=1 Tax=Treponema sp. OMZ 792 TaxID=2563667 RepID=UPI0020A583EF|nr:glycosyltransferase [Treponema sp. OMZ 792]
MNAEITVVIPTYNKAAYISQTIESVLKQTYQDFEIVIVDDCSQDDTELVVQEYLSDRIRYFKHLRNWGPGATFNDGIEKANTEYVTLIASDDILLPNHLEQVMLQFKKDDLVETVFPKLKVIDENGNDLNEVIEQPFFDKYKMLNHLFYAGNDIPSPGVSFKKSLFKKTAAYNRNLIMMHDYDLNVRCLIHGKIAVVDEPTVYYRRFSNPIINLSGKTKWLDMCLSIESKFVLDNYLSLGYDDMKKIFPHLEACNRKEIKFRFLIDACKNKQVRLSSWAFERLVSCLENNKDFLILMN